MANKEIILLGVQASETAPAAPVAVPMVVVGAPALGPREKKEERGRKVSETNERF